MAWIVSGVRSERNAALTPIVPAGERFRSVAEPNIPRKFPIKFLGAGIAVVLLIAVLVVYGLPLMSGEHEPVNSTAGETLNVTLEPTPPTILPTSPVILPTTPSEIVEIHDDRTGQTYLQVYHSQENYTPGPTKVFSYSVNTHLLVRFNVTPEMIRHDKVIKLGLTTEQTIRADSPDPASFFEMDIVDSDGYVNERQGFNGEFGSDTMQEFIVHSTGNIRFIMSGAKVNTDVQIFEAKN